MSIQSPSIRGVRSRPVAGRTTRVTTAAVAAVALAMSVPSVAAAQSAGQSSLDPG